MAKKDLYIYPRRLIILQLKPIPRITKCDYEMTIRFTKMHGLGNDFMVIDGINQNLNLNPELITSLAKRNTGIGFDQCLLIEPSSIPGVDFNYRIFNADGQEVGQCGNGARCLARFAKFYGLTTKNSFTVATRSTQMKLQINADDSVSVEMKRPCLEPALIPFVSSHQSSEYTLELDDNKTVFIHALSVGNPHAILLVDNIHTAELASLGPQISLHPRFPEQTNAGFMQIINSERIKLRVYERGCGETLACGSGATAAAAAGRLFHNMEEQITVELLGGELIISWPQLDGPITLTGPASFIYEGILNSQ